MHGTTHIVTQELRDITQYVVPSMTECVRCGATEDLEAGTAVGSRDPDADPLCNECLAETLEEVTMLSEREAQVVAFRQVADLRFDLVAESLEIAENTANEYYRRAREKALLAERTTQELTEFL